MTLYCWYTNPSSKAYYLIFSESAHWANSVKESPCPYVACMSVCLSVTIQNNFFRRSWRLMVEECIANIGMQWHNFSIFFVLMVFSCLKTWLGSWSQPTVANGVVSWGRVPSPSLPPPLKKKLIPPQKILSENILWYWCYYPHPQRESGSPICGIVYIFSEVVKLKSKHFRTSLLKAIPSYSKTKPDCPLGSRQSLIKLHHKGKIHPFVIHHFLKC